MQKPMAVALEGGGGRNNDLKGGRLRNMKC